MNWPWLEFYEDDVPRTLEYAPVAMIRSQGVQGGKERACQGLEDGDLAWWIEDLARMLIGNGKAVVPRGTGWTAHAAHADAWGLRRRTRRTASGFGAACPEDALAKRSRLDWRPAFSGQPSALVPASA